MSERELHKLTWERFLKGEEAALLDVYSQHYLGLMNFGKTIAPDGGFVNDCFMDMLLEFWNKRQSLPPVENVRSYLMTSFRRAIIHRLHADERREAKHLESAAVYGQHQVSYEDHLVRILSDQQLKERIARALGKLSERQAELVRLRFFDDLDYDEIAEKCGITKRTAYNIVYDAIKLLKNELAGDRDSLFSLAMPLLLLAMQDLMNWTSGS